MMRKLLVVLVLVCMCMQARAQDDLVLDCSAWANSGYLGFWSIAIDLGRGRARIASDVTSHIYLSATRDADTFYLHNEVEGMGPQSGMRVQINRYTGSGWLTVGAPSVGYVSYSLSCDQGMRRF
jgi:hypothetical protein